MATKKTQDIDLGILRVIGLNGALAAIKALGWDQVEDANADVELVDDITLDPNTADLEGEYLIDGDHVIRMRDGFRAHRIWVRAA